MLINNGTNNMLRIPITINGEKKLRTHLERLLKRRSEISKKIAESKCLGDLRENTEYHLAREEQAFCEAEIIKIKDKLASAHIIDVTKLPISDKVVFGSTVTLIDKSNNKNICYRIAGDDEANINNNIISFNSPIAKGIIGKYEKDEVSIQTPGGIKIFKIKKVDYI